MSKLRLKELQELCEKEGTHDVRWQCARALPEALAEIERLQNENQVAEVTYTMHATQNLKMQKEIERLRAALEFYANKKDWAEFFSAGGIFDELDGDQVMAFNKGEDAPYLIASEALSPQGESLKEKPE